MHNREVVNLFERLCASAAGDEAQLGVTEKEAEELLCGIVDKTTLLEKIKKIKIARKQYKMNIYARYQKCYEVLGHNGMIERMCFDNSCKFAFSGGADGIVKCWSVASGMLVRSLYGHENNIVSDLCINKKGDLLVSVDYQGTLNIWGLKDFNLLHTVHLNSEAIFCEFVNQSTDKANTHKIFIILSDGTVRSIEFNESCIKEQIVNSFMEGECIKSICITDGGRLVICGGWWPFFLVYDTQDLGNLIVLENFKIQSLCAAKNSLKFAASSENRIFSYTFYCEGPASLGNFNKKRNGDGYWKKHTNSIDEAYLVEWICFLPSFLLVAACTDNFIRIYEDEDLILSFEGEVGAIYAHPIQNIFAVVGTRLCIYQINSPDEFPVSTYDRVSFVGSDQPVITISRENNRTLKATLVYAERIYISINDCQFSDDGRYFVTCDDQGVIRTYSVNDPIEVPEQQFFLSDLDRRLEGQELEQNFKQTVNFYKQLNEGWNRHFYEISSCSGIGGCVRIEDLAIQSLERLKLNETRFQRQYLTREDTQHTAPEESDDETYVMSDDENTTEVSSSIEDDARSELLIASEESSAEWALGNRKLRGFKTAETLRSTQIRKRMIITDSSETEETGKRRAPPVNEQRVLRRSLTVISSDESEITNKRILRRMHNTSNTSNTSTTAANANENSLPRRVLRRMNSTSSTVNADGIDPSFESLLETFSYDWLAISAMHKGKEVYFNVNAYKEFMKLEPRLNYSATLPHKSGIFTITSIKHKLIGKIPYLQISLDSNYAIKLYEYPDSSGIICTVDQLRITVDDAVAYCNDSEFITGRVSALHEMKVTVNNLTLIRGMIAPQYTSLGICKITCTPDIKPFFSLSKPLKVGIRPIITYSQINFKLASCLYANQEEFFNDLKYLARLASSLEEPLKSASMQLYKRYTSGNNQ
ncbi:hypothetical protein GINT2_000855 [Glugoides intestinalis]